MTDPVNITFYADESIRLLLEQWASDEDRSISSLLRRLIEAEKQRRELDPPPWLKSTPPDNSPESA